MFDGVLLETKCDLDKSGRVAGDGYEESRPRASQGESARSAGGDRCRRPMGPAPAIASATTWSAAAPGDGAAHGPPLIVGTPAQALAAPSELHPAGRHCALTPPYPAYSPLLHSLERTCKRVQQNRTPDCDRQVVHSGVREAPVYSIFSGSYSTSLQAIDFPGGKNVSGDFLGVLGGLFGGLK
jgi:hypothetical protein